MITEQRLEKALIYRAETDEEHAKLKTKVDLAKEQKIKLILVEENFGAGMFIELLKPYLAKEYPCSLEGVRH